MIVNNSRKLLKAAMCFVCGFGASDNVLHSMDHTEQNDKSINNSNMSTSSTKQLINNNTGGPINDICEQITANNRDSNLDEIIYIAHVKNII